MDTSSPPYIPSRYRLRTEEEINQECTRRAGTKRLWPQWFWRAAFYVHLWRIGGMDRIREFRAAVADMYAKHPDITAKVAITREAFLPATK